jgi:hypothetical protein
MKKTSILIAASTECNNNYKSEIVKAKNELEAYFGNKLTVKESMESSFPIIAINAELTTADVENLNEMFPEDRATQLLILCYEEETMNKETMNNDILYVQ